MVRRSLAVDIPSGLSGLTGLAGGDPARAACTVTFAALKPGLVLGDGPGFCGEVVVADIGLDTSTANTHLVEDADVLSWIPSRPTDDHKWRHAVWIIAGSPGMSGAAHLCTAAAMRSGSGYVRLSTPGAEHVDAPIEAVQWPLPATGWAAEVRGADVGRFSAVVIGPGLGARKRTGREVRAALADIDRPMVLDGDGLAALRSDPSAVLAGRPAATVLTPHDGEFSRLTGSAPGENRIAAASDLARRCGATVLLKGTTTVVAAGSGEVLLVRAGDSRLATAGTGDVLSGIIAAHLALGVDPARAAAAGAHVHGLAARMGHARGLVASDLPDLVPEVWDALGSDAADVSE